MTWYLVKHRDNFTIAFTLYFLELMNQLSVLHQQVCVCVFVFVCVAFRDSR